MRQEDRGSAIVRRVDPPPGTRNVSDQELAWPFKGARRGGASNRLDESGEDLISYGGALHSGCQLAGCTRLDGWLGARAGRIPEATRVGGPRIGSTALSSAFTTAHATMPLSSASSSSHATPESTPPTSPPISPSRAARLSAKTKAQLAVPVLPTAVIDGAAISPTMAARLTLCALGHVLFLKDQIPYPVGQLAKLAARIDPSAAPSKSTKKLVELLDVYDVLACHLHTTFDALSRALAKNVTRYPPPSRDASDTVYPNAQTHLILAVGQTIATSRSRVILELDGFEVKAYGCDVDPASTDDAASDDESGSDDFYYEDELPPLGAEEDVDDSSDEEGDEDHQNEADALLAAQQEAAFVQAERMLSRTISGADAFCAEMAPTNTHVLLRAPRCFAHPEWVAQPRFQRVLDTHLAQRKEGVRVCCKAAPTASPDLDVEEDDEDNEMIWWMWNGKLSGFVHQ